MEFSKGKMESMEVSHSFWKNRKVFITGHTGFKGSWLTIWLEKMGAVVTGYSLPPNTNPSLFELAQVEKNITSLYGDIRDYENLKKAIQIAEPEVVLHLAAQPLVRESYLDPISTYSTNVMGTVHLLDSVRHTPSVRSVVIVTSDKCYENKEWPWAYRENEPMGGFDPYSNSKGCSELVTSSYRSSFFNLKNFESHKVGVASARAGNVIGGGDWAKDRLVPDILKSFETSNDVVIRNPLAIRPWQHVLEPLSGYLLLAQALYSQGPKFADAWNFGPNEDEVNTVESIVKTMCSMWGDTARYKIQSESNQPHEAFYLKLDSSKARMLLPWQPRWTLKKALQNTIDWHRSFLTNKTQLKEICHQQISLYESDFSNYNRL